MTEVWKDVVGYEGSYEVSNKGRVRSIDRIYKRKSGNWKLKGRILKQNISRLGYKMVSLSSYGKGEGFTVHRLVAIAFIDNPENKSDVNHIDGDKTNNNVENLEWCSREENMKHASENYLMRNIEKSDINSIIEDFNRGMTIRKLMKKYKTSYPSIKEILTNSGIHYTGNKNRIKVHVDIEEVITLFESGKNYSEISREMDVSDDVIAHRIKNFYRKNTNAIH